LNAVASSRHRRTRAVAPLAPTPWLRAADARGLARLGVDATLGIADLVEAMHQTITSRAGIVGPARGDRTRGVTGFVYGAVRGTTRVVGKGLDAALGALDALTGPAPAASAPARETLLAVLNGVWGDHLAASSNPLAIPMTFRVAGQTLDLEAQGFAAHEADTHRLDVRLPHATGKLLVLVHGLCMNDLQWTREGHDHGQALARDLGYTPVYLHYNSGRHVSDNGSEFAELLERLIEQWPVPVQEVVIVSHSMGGLVTRSACHLAEQARSAWLSKLTKLVFLGTPHHGAPLERGGHQIDMLLGVSPYVAPFSRLGKARSAGITDLHFGAVQPADRHGSDRHGHRHDARRPTPLPTGVKSYLVAATGSLHVGGVRSRLIGDGLVPVASALGEHRDPKLSLKVPPSLRYVATAASHWDLLSRADVYAQLKAWLS